MREGGKDSDVSSFPSAFCSSVAANLNNINPSPTSLDVLLIHITPATRTPQYKEMPPAKPTKLNKLGMSLAFQVMIQMGIPEIDSRSVRWKGEFGAQSRPCWPARALDSRRSERRR